MRDRYKKDVTAERFDAVWCVFDREGHNEPEDFVQAIEQARKEELQTCISQPSFECWLLHHFDIHIPHLANSEAAEMLLCSQHLLPEYIKGQSCFRKIQAHLDKAITHARKQHQRLSREQDDVYPNPSTEVYKLVEELMHMQVVHPPDS